MLTQSGVSLGSSCLLNVAKAIARVDHVSPGAAASPARYRASTSSITSRATDPNPSGPWSRPAVRIRLSTRRSPRLATTSVVRSMPTSASADISATSASRPRRTPELIGWRRSSLKTSSASISLTVDQCRAAKYARNRSYNRLAAFSGRRALRRAFSYRACTASSSAMAASRSSMSNTTNSAIRPSLSRPKRWSNSS